MSPKISVIVPVYNTGKKLKICLKSILSQDFVEYECILVDDGSSDDLTISLCKEITEKDNRFKYFRKHNEGIEKTRLYGVKKSSCSLIIFCDHDDYYEKTAFSTLYNNWQKSKADIVVANCYSQLFYKIPIRKKIIGLNSDIIVDRNEFLDKYYKNFFGINLFPVSSWGKLYSKRLFEEEVTTLGYNFFEDIIFNSQIFKRAQKIHFIPDFIYTHIWGGLSSDFNPQTSLKGYVEAYQFKKSMINDLENYDSIHRSILIEFKNVVNQKINQMIDYGYIQENFVEIIRIIEDQDIMKAVLNEDFEKGPYFDFLKDYKYSELFAYTKKQKRSSKYKIKLFLKKIIKS